jgi:hypothetical protein
LPTYAATVRVSAIQIYSEPAVDSEVIRMALRDETVDVIDGPVMVDNQDWVRIVADTPTGDAWVRLTDSDKRMMIG